MTGRISDREAAREVAHRMAVLREKHRHRLRRTLMVAGVLCFALLACVTALPGLGQAEPVRTPQGSALEVAAAPATGGYVLVGVLCFVLGIAFVLVCLWIRDRGRKK